MKKIIQTVTIGMLSAFSVSAYSECSVELPYEKLTDCIVFEGAEKPYNYEGDQISTELRKKTGVEQKAKLPDTDYDLSRLSK